jgi:hypothetical protein
MHKNHYTSETYTQTKGKEIINLMGVRKPLYVFLVKKIHRTEQELKLNFFSPQRKTKATDEREIRS